MWHFCDGGGDGYIGAVDVLVADANIDVVAPGANRTRMEADVKGVNELDESEGNGNELGSALDQPLLSWLSILPNSPLLLGWS